MRARKTLHRVLPWALRRAHHQDPPETPESHPGVHPEVSLGAHPTTEPPVGPGIVHYHPQNGKNAEEILHRSWHGDG